MKPDLEAAVEKLVTVIQTLQDTDYDGPAEGVTRDEAEAIAAKMILQNTEPYGTDIGEMLDNLRGKQ